jgi:bacterioferritin-associated ferredoxin
MKHEEIEKLTPDYIVCECFDVTLGTLLDAIKSGHNTLEALMDKTDAGTACELCQSKEIDEDEDRELHLDEILEYAKVNMLYSI